MDKRADLFIKFIFSLLLFVAVFYLVGFEKIAEVLFSMDLGLFALALLLYVFVNLLMSLRIRLVLSSIGEKLGIRQIFPSSLAGMLASDFTPSRAGYFFTAFSLSSKFNIKIEKTILAIFGPQLLDFTIKSVSAAIMLAVIINYSGSDGMLLNMVLLLFVFSAIAVAGLLVFYPPFLGRLRFLEHIPLASRAFAFLTRMHEHSDKLLSIKWKILGITLMNWLLKGVEWFILSRAINLHISDNPLFDLGFIMIFQAAITIIQFVPLPTLAGAGASEAGFAAILYFFGVPLEVGITFGFLTRLVMIIIDAFALPVLYDFVHKYGVEGLLSHISSKV
ncbi:MAG: lysylphosphatidylglycerol synthase transmembrane domain-containing protein [Candidatus Micrarchaeota archaeon]